jgi:isoleucyl-tRNA synthetase
MNHEYQATIVKEFGKFLLSDSVYKGKKPVHWCPTCKTALAEAEVKYENHRSPSIYVRFKMVSTPSRLEGEGKARGNIEEMFPSLRGKTVYVIIWTTTPWTIPANLAIAFHPDFTYVAAEVNGDIYILAEALLETVMEKCGIKNYSDSGKFSAKLSVKLSAAILFLTGIP